MQVAAAIHDYKHPGLNNKFLGAFRVEESRGCHLTGCLSLVVSTSHDLALTYNDKAVLENVRG